MVASECLWLRSARSQYCFCKQFPRSGNHVNRLGNLRIVFGQDLQRSHRSESGGGQLEPQLLLDELSILVQLRNKNFPIWIFCDKVLEGVIDRVVHRKVVRHQVVLVFNRSINLVAGQTSYATVRHFARKEKDRIAHAHLQTGKELRFHSLVRSNAATAVNRTTSVSSAGRPSGLFGTVFSERAATIDVVVPAAV